MKKIHYVTGFTGGGFRIDSISEGIFRIIGFHPAADITRGVRQHQDERLEFLAQNGVKVSRMVAHTLCRGPVSRRLLVRPVAWFLREAVEHRFLMGALEKFISLMGSESFTSIISSIDRANPMKLRMSQRRKGS